MMFSTAGLVFVVVVILRKLMVAVAQAPHDGVKQNFTVTVSPVDGQSQCARNNSGVVIEPTLNHAKCAVKCFNVRNCSSYNYFYNTTRCELFSSIPISYSYEMLRCIHYHVSEVIVNNMAAVLNDELLIYDLHTFSILD